MTLPCAALLSGTAALPYESGTLSHGSAAALPNGFGSLSQVGCYGYWPIVAIFGHKEALVCLPLLFAQVIMYVCMCVCVCICVRVLCILFLHCTDESQKGETASFILVVCS